MIRSHDAFKLENKIHQLNEFGEEIAKLTASYRRLLTPVIEMTEDMTVEDIRRIQSALNYKPAKVSLQVIIIQKEAEAALKIILGKENNDE